MISFSRLPPYDPSIKYISHLSDFTPLLYPQSPLTHIEYQWRLREYRKFLKQSSAIIIPHRDTLTIMNEFFSPPEEKITVIPYLSPLYEETYRIRTILPHGIFGDYFLTEGTDTLEWRPLELLEAYASYIHRMG